MTDSVCVACRNLSCENILLCEGFHVKLSDYGHAPCKCNLDILVDSSCTHPSTLQMYRAPEMLRGQPYKTQALDIWSLYVL